MSQSIIVSGETFNKFSPSYVKKLIDEGRVFSLENGLILLDLDGKYGEYLSSKQTKTREEVE